MKLFEKIRNVNRKDGVRGRNNGAAMIAVIVAIAFIGMLVAMIIYTAYGNYLMKFNDKRAKDTFYTAEQAMNMIHSGLQTDVSECIVAAFSNAQTNRASAASTLDLDNMYQQYFAEQMLKRMGNTIGAGSYKWKISYFNNMLTNAGLTVTTTPGATGACIQVKNGASGATEGDVTVTTGTDDNNLLIKGLRLTYTDPAGYVSVVETDIRVAFPSFGAVAEQGILDLESNSLMAQDSIIMDKAYNLVTSSNDDIAPLKCEISGSVFAGDKDGLLLSSGSELTFKPNPSETDNDYRIITNRISSIDTGRTSDTNGIFISDNYATYAQNILVDSGLVALSGVTSVGDDLTMEGKKSKVILKDKYYGYGNKLDSAGGSSSIILNGADSYIDARDLSELMLSGAAFIGSMHYDADATRYDAVFEATTEGKASEFSDYIEDVDDYKQKLADSGYTAPEEDPDNPLNNPIKSNDKDLLMGESAATKAEQMIYLIPSYCIQYMSDNGNIITGRNPMPYEEYIDQSSRTITDPDSGLETRFELVNLTNLWNRLDGTGYTSKYTKVFRRYNGTLLVYFFLDFEDDIENANNYVEAYYRYQKDDLDKLISSYYDKNSEWNENLYTLGEDEEVASALTIAGTMFYYDDRGDLQMIPRNADKSTEKSELVRVTGELMTEDYEALISCGKTANELVNFPIYAKTRGMFENVVLTSVLENEIQDSTFDKNEEGGAVSSKAVSTIGDYVYDAAAKANNIVVIVAKGDIYLHADFNGIAISGGKIIIGNGCTKVNNSREEVRQAMTAKDDHGHYAYELINGGANAYKPTALVTTGGDRESDYQDLGSLITYHNWQKE